MDNTMIMREDQSDADLTFMDEAVLMVSSSSPLGSLASAPPPGPCC